MQDLDFPTNHYLFEGYRKYGADVIYVKSDNAVRASIERVVDAIDDRTALVPISLVLFRSAQSIGLGFLFVPLTTIAFISIPRRLNADAAALFTMFRNVAGSIGISLSTAAITERSQAHSAHLAYHASPFNEQFQLAIRESAQAIQNFTTQVGDPTGIATGRMYQTMIEQSRFLAYIDVFTILSVVAMLLIPFCLLLSPVKSEGSAGAH
jgi:DHA2 family multidrug resistance protein